jgi:selenocysteine lyase/cysteine desulfurase
VAESSLRQILEWGVKNIAETLGLKTDKIATKAKELGYDLPPQSMRAPHMIGLSNPGGVSGDLAGKLSEKNIYVSVRGDAIRIAPHLYNSDEDLDRLFDALQLAH